MDLRAFRQAAAADNGLLPQCAGQERLPRQPKCPIHAAEAELDVQRTARLLQYRRLPEPHISAVAGTLQHHIVVIILRSRHAWHPLVQLDKQE